MEMVCRDSLTLYKSLGLDDPAHGVMTCGAPSRLVGLARHVNVDVLH